MACVAVAGLDADVHHGVVAAVVPGRNGEAPRENRNRDTKPEPAVRSAVHATAETG